MADLGQMANSVAVKFGIPPEIFYSLIGKESGNGAGSPASTWNPNAVGSSGEKGLAQLMPNTASSMGVSNAFDPLENMTGGAGYLSKLYKQYGDWTSALSAYNSGSPNSSVGLQYASSVLNGAGVSSGSNTGGSSSGPSGIVSYGVAAVVILILTVFGVWGVVKG